MNCSERTRGVEREDKNGETDENKTKYIQVGEGGLVSYTFKEFRVYIH